MGLHIKLITDRCKELNKIPKEIREKYGLHIWGIEYGYFQRIQIKKNNYTIILPFSDLKVTYDPLTLGYWNIEIDDIIVSLSVSMDWVLVHYNRNELTKMKKQLKSLK